MKVYLVIDDEYSPGRVLAVMAHQEDAVAFMNMLESRAEVEESSVIYGQPSVRGYNP